MSCSHRYINWCCNDFSCFPIIRWYWDTNAHPDKFKISISSKSRWKSGISSDCQHTSIWTKIRIIYSWHQEIYESQKVVTCRQNPAVGDQANCLCWCCKTRIKPFTNDAVNILFEFQQRSKLILTTEKIMKIILKIWWNYRNDSSPCSEITLFSFLFQEKQPK